ncbi:hypothetical protein, partial, partial [Absidia glauca]
MSIMSTKRTRPTGLDLNFLVLCRMSKALDIQLHTHRVAVLKLFFRAMKDRGLNTTFMFCDKGMAEINAIEATWNPSVVRLCLWHLKRAVKTKLGQPK